MKNLSVSVLGTLAATLLLAPFATAQEGKESGQLSCRAYKKWSFIMPEEVWTDVGAGGIKIPHPNGSSFQAERDGLSLEIDTTGDGRLNEDVKGVKGFVRLRSKGDGKKFEYAIRLMGSSSGYKYSTSCAMEGTVAGVPLRLIDLNNNGVYNEYGKDAMIVGKGKVASYLSKVVSYKGHVFDCEVNNEGSEVSLTPHEGDKGIISAYSGFKAHGKLVSAVITNDAGDVSFNLTDSKEMTLPVGNYTLKSGLVTKGSFSVKVRQGKMQPVKVEAGKELDMRWGSKVIAELSFRKEGKDVKIEPKDVKYFGIAGEEYYDFKPTGKSPKFVVLDAKQRELGKGIFGA